MCRLGRRYTLEEWSQALNGCKPLEVLCWSELCSEESSVCSAVAFPFCECAEARAEEWGFAEFSELRTGLEDIPSAKGSL
eukprot:5241653-Amphidinium_carterae.1